MDLRNVRRAKARIDQIKEHIEVLNSAKEYGERIQRTGSGGGYPTDKMSRIVARIEELTDELVSTTLDYDIEVTMAEHAIETLPEPERRIAQARYFEGLSWSEVAARTRYSVGHCRNANLAIVRKVENF